jgi:hypothetical protein
MSDKQEHELITICTVCVCFAIAGFIVTWLVGELFGALMGFYS